MENRETILDGLREIAEQETSDGIVDGVSQELIRGALEMLKEQEPIEPDYDPATLTWSCGNCGQTFDRCKNKFCPKCGREVKWDE